MSFGFLILIVLALASGGFVMGRARAVAQAGGDIRNLHSLPPFYGRITLLWTAVPALLLIAAWPLAEPIFIETKAVALIVPDPPTPILSHRRVPILPPPHGQRRRRVRPLSVD